MNFILPDHFGEREAEFRRAHRAAERDHHFAAVVEMRDVTARGVHERRGVEVAIVVLDELRNRSAGNFGLLFLGHNCLEKFSPAYDKDVCAIANLKFKLEFKLRLVRARSKAGTPTAGSWWRLKTVCPQPDSL
jgi:hypothetical protein